jgi:hypothetical protein
MHNEELHNLYSSPNIIRQIKENEVGAACSTHGRGEKGVHGFGGKSRRNETTRKTEAQMRGWDQNGSYGDWLAEVSGFKGVSIGTGGGLL